MLRLPSFLSTLKGKGVAVITHSGADVDGLASAACFYEALKEGFSVKILVPDHLNQNAKQLAENLGIKYSVGVPSQGFDGLIIVDLNSYEMLGPLEGFVKGFKGPILLLDHHSKPGENLVKASHFLVDEGAVSSTELVLELFKRSRVRISKRIAELVFCGIVTDSAGFRVADGRALELAAGALRIAGRDVSEAVSLFSTEKDISERIAVLKASQRSRLYRFKDFLFAFTNVGCFEASAADALVRSGADAAFAGNIERGRLLLSGRASHKFLKLTGFDLSKDIFFKLSGFFQGSGGGHPGAASFEGKAVELEAVFSKCIELLNGFLGKKFKGAALKDLT